MSDDDAELVKAGVEGIVEGSLKPFSDLISSLFGPVASEAGLMLKDHVQHFRVRRQVRLFERTAAKLREAGVEPTSVELKLLLPIIEHASVESDDDLQDIWANLLTNAADPRPESWKVLRSFPSILKELGSADVKFLDALYRRARDLAPCPKPGDLESVTFELEDLFSVYSRTGLAMRSYYIRPSHEDLALHLDDVKQDKQSIQIILDSLIRQRLLSSDTQMPEILMGYTQPPMKIAYSLTHLGVMFVKACQPAASREDAEELELPTQ
ncbi:MAG: Abi-alpha family protein [Acidobacteriota bacterium]|nr:Abi-alpha family protein [Acidobacteriota bacterium]